jgi:hypothetical protein
MKSAAILIAAGFLALNATPSFGQVITPNLQPPPCSGQNCLFRPRGARVMPPGAGAAQKTACPQGTVYNPRRGTCKVMPTIAGTP